MNKRRWLLLTLMGASVCVIAGWGLALHVAVSHPGVPTYSYIPILSVLLVVMISVAGLLAVSSAREPCELGHDDHGYRG